MLSTVSLALLLLLLLLFRNAVLLCCGGPFAHRQQICVQLRWQANDHMSVKKLRGRRYAIGGLVKAPSFGDAPDARPPFIPRRWRLSISLPCVGVLMNHRCQKGVPNHLHLYSRCVTPVQLQTASIENSQSESYTPASSAVRRPARWRRPRRRSATGSTSCRGPACTKRGAQGYVQTAGGCSSTPAHPAH